MEKPEADPLIGEPHRTDERIRIAPMQSACGRGCERGEQDCTGEGEREGDARGDQEQEPDRPPLAPRIRVNFFWHDKFLLRSDGLNNARD